MQFIFLFNQNKKTKVSKQIYVEKSLLTDKENLIKKTK